MGRGVRRRGQWKHTEKDALGTPRTRRMSIVLSIFLQKSTPARIRIPYDGRALFLNVCIGGLEWLIT